MARAMKDSGIEWIGEIPEGWSIRKMNMVCSVVTDYVASGSFADLAKNVEYLDEPDYAMLVRTADVSNKARTSKAVYINKQAYDFLRNSNLFGGELLFPNIGAVGDVYIVPKLYERMSLAPNSIICKTVYNDKYYYYFFLCQAGRQSLIEISQSTAQAKFNKTDFKQIRALVPPLAEQNKLVEFLDKECARIDVVIEQTRASIEEYKKLKQSVITQAVTKGIRPGRKMKDSGVDWIGEIPEEWSMERGKGLFVEVDNRSTDGSEELLTVSQYTGVTPRSQKNVNMFEAETLEGYKICEVGDIAANTMWLWAGAIGVSNYRGVISPSYNIYRQKGNHYNPTYLDYLLRASPLVQHYESMSTGIRASRLRLYPQQFLSIRYPVPAMEEQKEVVRFLKEKTNGIELLIQKKEQYLSEIESYKKSLIFEYVTGKKEVPA